MISATLLPVFHVMLAAKAGPQYLSEIRCAYGAFFFAILGACLLSLYLLNEIPSLKIAAPFVLVILMLVMVNSRQPYQPHVNAGLVHKLIPAFVEADSRGHTEITLYLPEISPRKWELDCLTDTLYNHRVTFSKIEIRSIEYSFERCQNNEDECVYYVP